MPVARLGSQNSMPSSLRSSQKKKIPTVIYLSSSSISTFRECGRKYQFKYILDRVPMRVSRALDFGRALHKCLESYWKKELPDFTFSDLEAEDQVKILSIMENYNPPKDYEVLGVEETFECPIPNPQGGRSFYKYALTGKIDLILRKDDKIWICDHKTTSKDITGFGLFWRALQIDGQMSIYAMAKNAHGFIYDAIKKPTIKMCGKDDNNPEKYKARLDEIIKSDLYSCFQWREFVRSDSECLIDLWQTVEKIRFGRFERNPTSCVGFFGECEYLDVCCGRDSIDSASFISRGSD
jgi:hypothetical protein